jgi:hypothetical protein
MVTSSFYRRVDQRQFNAGGTVLTFRAVAGHAIPIFINGASSLHILSLHSPIAMAVVIEYVVEAIRKIAVLPADLAG